MSSSGQRNSRVVRGQPLREGLQRRVERTAGFQLARSAEGLLEFLLELEHIAKVFRKDYNAVTAEQFRSFGFPDFSPCFNTPEAHRPISSTRTRWR